MRDIRFCDLNHFLRRDESSYDGNKNLEEMWMRCVLEVMYALSNESSINLLIMNLNFHRPTSTDEA